MELEFVLIIILTVLASVQELRIRRLEKELK